MDHQSATPTRRALGVALGVAALLALVACTGSSSSSSPPPVASGTARGLCRRFPPDVAGPVLARRSHGAPVRQLAADRYRCAYASGAVRVEVTLDQLGTEHDDDYGTRAEYVAFQASMAPTVIALPPPAGADRAYFSLPLAMVSVLRGSELVLVEVVLDAQSSDPGPGVAKLEERAVGRRVAEDVLATS